jgi:CBS domain containing-hemolysin-like protein
VITIKLWVMQPLFACIVKMDNFLLIDPFKLIALIFLVLTNGFFVAAEFALVSVRQSRVSELISQGNSDANWLQKVISDPDRVITLNQLGITASTLALGWFAGPALARLLAPLVELFPYTFQPGVLQGISISLAFTIILFLHLVIGELTPRSIALQNPEKTALLVAQPTWLSKILMDPLIRLLNGISSILLRFLGLQPLTRQRLIYSVEELKLIVSASAESGAMEEDEREMLHAIFDLSDLLARQTMIPRTEIAAVEADCPLSEITSFTSTSPYTKFPVYEDNLDQILGILYVKDLLRAVQSTEQEELTARDIAREAIFVPENITVSALLQEFRIQRQHIAIVLDEYGGTAGLVTLEDLLEEIVGEVSDQFDDHNPEFQVLPDGSILIDGLTLIDQVNEQLGLQLHDPHYDTIAGYLLGKLGRIPRLKDAVEGEGVRLQVEAMDGLRISRLSLNRLN